MRVLRAGEIGAALVLISVLGTILLPKLIGSHDRPQPNPYSDLAEIRSMLDHFRKDCGRYPTTEEGLRALSEAPENLKAWRGPYSSKPIGPDPWGNPYVYESAGSDYTLTSYGQDGKLGGEGYDADVRVTSAD